jgi:hypothetical protein
MQRSSCCWMHTHQWMLLMPTITQLYTMQRDTVMLPWCSCCWMPRHELGLLLQTAVHPYTSQPATGIQQ